MTPCPKFRYRQTVSTAPGGSHEDRHLCECGHPRSQHPEEKPVKVSGPPLYQVTVSSVFRDADGGIAESIIQDVTEARWVDGIFVIRTVQGETITYPERVVMQTRTRMVK